MTDPIGLDLAALSQWLHATHPELVGQSELSGERLQGGLSNLTYRITGGPLPFVLRRPPLGHVLRTAHDMSREYRVISGLVGSPVPVPAPILFDDDADNTAGVGTPFYLMEFVEGQVLSHPSANGGFTVDELRGLSFELVEILAALHDADPSDLGLADLGHPDGFLARQLRRWATQYGQSVSRDLPELDHLQNALVANVPETTFISVIHGDYRLDNAIVGTSTAGHPHIASILDWEMATLGDSLTDLGLLGLYWDIRTIAPGTEISANSAIDPAAGYPPFTELVERYTAARKIEIDTQIMSWYIAFAAFKLAIIIEGIHYRYIQGQTVGDGFDRIGESVLPLARFGLRALASTATQHRL